MEKQRLFLFSLLVVVVILFAAFQATGQENTAKSWSLAEDTFEYLGDTDITNGTIDGYLNVYRETTTNVMYVAQLRGYNGGRGGGLTVMLDPDYDGRPLTWTRYQELAKRNRQ